MKHSKQRNVGIMFEILNHATLIKEKQMLTTNNPSSVDYLYKVCKEHPLLVISTPHGVGKYHFNCIGYKNRELLLEFTLIS